MAQIKPDPDPVYIKPDPDNKDIVLADLEDDDIYEDAGDLDFSASAQNVWLTRLPQQLWDHWATTDENADDDEEIEIGTIRIEGDPGDMKRVSLRLHRREGNEDIPKDYTLQKQSMSTNAAHMTQNTFVFTEKDIPGAENRLATFGEKRSALYESMKRDARRKQQGKKWEPYVRKTVPKQTALVGQVNEEFNLLPVENEELRRISEKAAMEALKPKEKVQYVDDITPDITNAAILLPTNKGHFVQQIKPAKAKAQENKATRMPQNELLDRIFECFREYRYWPFKTLKAKLQQPESYLKETLEMVAHLVKAGDFAMTWELKPEAQPANYASVAHQTVKDEKPPDMDDYEDGSDDDYTASGMITDHD
ncbi:hypothetical protein POX_h09782 [Penicillium oxalicum]|uniref:Transcription initiation factor IIF subunit beta n=1 Tax=Penicillium oxalicum (strain 114-2 / CGMCC 5302) TaxID=933388 RepID=S7ZMC8_PENO1|nr:hypothetical protein POX_h09782 [Penicillium oxalicum]EPS31499.1 hypothetical protein PDE_06454 [Penicillium oxalicum 114-2]KAI2786017.1 hypothetical protein POX_h09782 [Penicillium oxalicum]